MKKELFLAMTVILVMGIGVVAWAGPSRVQFLTDAQMAAIAGKGCCASGAPENVSGQCVHPATACDSCIFLICTSCGGAYASACLGDVGTQCTSGAGTCVNGSAPCSKHWVAPCAGCTWIIKWPPIVECIPCSAGEQHEQDCGTKPNAGGC